MDGPNELYVKSPDIQYNLTMGGNVSLNAEMKTNDDKCTYLNKLDFYNLFKDEGLIVDENVIEPSKENEISLKASAKAEVKVETQINVNTNTFDYTMSGKLNFVTLKITGTAKVCKKWTYKIDHSIVIFENIKLFEYDSSK